MNSRKVAMKINAAASKADTYESYNTDLYVRIPGVGLREVRKVRLDEDAAVVLELTFIDSDAGATITGVK